MTVELEGTTEVQAPVHEQEHSAPAQQPGGGIKEALGLKDAPGDISEGKEKRVANAIKRAIHKDLKHDKGHVNELFDGQKGEDRLSRRQERKIIEKAIDVQFDNNINNHNYGSEPELRAALQKELQGIEVHYEYKQREEVDGKKQRVEKTNDIVLDVDNLRDKHGHKEHFEQANESPLERKGVKLLAMAAEVGLGVVASPAAGVAAAAAIKIARKTSDLGGENWAGHMDEKLGKVIPNSDQDLSNFHLAVEGFKKADKEVIKQGQEDLKKDGIDLEKTGKDLLKKGKGRGE